MFERENFVFLTTSDEWRFWDEYEQTVQEWDWDSDIKALADANYDITADWWYEPIDWKSERTGSSDWFTAIRNS